ncbi:EscU/YscU/HrcU family type III secretion system export apparatus switch protein [Terasakiella pusilla]|uniref:EscU/YscU/HrcU family type III secretion system export apparatus switch protein n=1 Tax=Terasakiella pusilla TaxID=64973 RepID=UPI001F0A1AE5|nr:EscU/YscU/HrcU family type III secretion system export apparatus switch protein [Terasakiella pusilla]
MSNDIPKMRKPNDPDQIAVALSYAGIEDTAPEILASGRGAIAEQILQIAFEQGVRVREDADLAQVLGLLDVGEEIPVEAFAAVAEILAYVYRANGEDMPGVDVPLKPKEPAFSDKNTDEEEDTP